MNTYIQPKKETWNKLLQRPYQAEQDIRAQVQQILSAVAKEGDNAIRRFTKTFDKVSIDAIAVSKEEIEAGVNATPKALKEAIALATTNIERFHESQAEKTTPVVTNKGVVCWRKNVAIEKVGLYIPGGTAPLFSTVLMLGIPAKIAGCKEIILCSPCNKEGKLPDAVLYAAWKIGITQIYKVGGAQAIAAMAYGTETVPKVYKIFGPGNQYVTKAKEMVQEQGLAIDMPAGPSELLVIADESSKPAFVAADLLSQAEHGTDSQVVLLTDSKRILVEVSQEINQQLEVLPRKEIAKKALQNSNGIVMENMKEAVKFSNAYAPEHLIIATKDYNEMASGITNAGSVFLGNYSCESAGDYASGTNHTLPTNGFAKNYSGVSLDSYVKKITFQEISKEGIQSIGPAIEIMAAAEQLEAHKNAVSVRLKSIKND